MFMRYKSEFNELHWCGSLAWSMLSFLDPSPGIILLDLTVCLLILDLKHAICGLFLTFKSKLFHNKTVDCTKDVIDILSLLLGVA